MADYIPTSAEFDRDNNVTDWSRTTVADGNWLQKNTIGPLKQRDIELLELIRQHKGNVYSAGDYINIDENNVISVSGLSGTESWMRFSIDNGSEDFAEEAENDYYIGKENSAFGRAKIIGDNNMALNSTVIGDNNVGISTSELIKKDGTLAHYETVGIYPAQNFIVGDGNVATKTRNAFIFGNDNYTETTEADLQLDCDPDDPNIKGQNNDGFTLAFGLCNSAIRNYDMAIGKDVLASGGENIVIGTPLETHAIGVREPYKTGSIGYRNLNIRSKIDGAGNKAFESIVTSNTNNCTSETQDNILDYSDVFISGNPNNKIQFRRNTLSHAEDISVKTTAHNELIVHNNEFNDVRQLHFSAIDGQATPTVEANTIIKAEQLEVTANRFANNNLYDVHYGNASTSNISVHHFINNNLSRINQMDISGEEFNNNTFDNIAVPHESILNIDYAYFNILKNIKNTSSPVKIEANKFNYNLLLNTDIPDLSGDPEGYTCYAHNIFFNIAQSEPSSLTWTIKKTMENNILLNSNNGGDHNHIILENPEFVSNNIVFHSTLSAVSAEGRDDTILNNVIINATANANFSGNVYTDKEYFVNNFLFNAVLDSEPTHEGLIVTAHGYETVTAHQVSNASLGQNFIFGATAKNVAGSFIFSDGQTNGNAIPAIRYDNRIVAFGDEFILYSNDSIYLGNENSAHFNNNCFIAGECNKMCISGLANDWYVGKSLTNESCFSRCFILGVENELVLDQPLCPEDYTVTPTAPARNFLIGSKNKIHVSGNYVTQNILIGDSNALGYNKNGSDLGGWGFGYTCYADRNLLFGTNNKLSDKENDNIILGNNNIVASETPSDDNYPIYSTNIAIGGFNSAFNGSNQINIGYHNKTKEHFAGTIGRYLESHGNQLIVGQLNDYPSTQPATLLASAWDGNDAVAVENSGVLFAVGNGRVNAFEHDHKYYTTIENGSPSGQITEADIYPDSVYVTPSNAMIVSADGTVSARTYKADPTTPLGKLFDFLTTATLVDGDLHWDAANSKWTFV